MKIIRGLKWSPGAHHSWQQVLREETRSAWQQGRCFVWYSTLRLPYLTKISFCYCYSAGQGYHWFTFAFSRHFFPPTRKQSSCLGKRTFCTFIGHENDIIIFIDGYMPIHISVVSCDGQSLFLLRTCCFTRFVKEICSFGQWFGLHCISYASLSDWWVFNKVFQPVFEQFTSLKVMC